MTSREKAKRRMIREAIQTNLESWPGKARKVRVRRQLSRWASTSLLSATALLALTSVVVSKGKASPSIAVKAHAAIVPVSYTAPRTEVTVPTTAPRELTHAVLPLSIKRIVIDPGHGGDQTGAVSDSGLMEKDVTLDIALRLRKLLEGSPFEVLMTRQTDRTVSLADRVKFANSNRADLFVSIHINSMEHSIHPLETYYVGPSKDPHVLQLASIENQRSGYTLSEYRQLLDKVYLDSRRDDSRLLAKTLDAELYQSLKPRNPKLQDRGVKRAPFAVLMGTDMPAVLAEVSSVSNHGDVKLLRDDQYRQQIALALFKGITSYANYLNGNRRKGVIADGKQ